jgi:ATP dependent DNA ligase domain
VPISGIRLSAKLAANSGNFRIIARKSDGQVRLYSRPGNDFTRRFPLIAEALARLRSRSCIIDGEAVACDDNGSLSCSAEERRWLMEVGIKESPGFSLPGFQVSSASLKL